MMGSVTWQVSWALHPLTLIDTEHHRGRALESTLSEPISFTGFPLSGCLSLSKATDNAAGESGGKSQNPFGFNQALPLVSYMVLGNLRNLAEPLFPDL